MKQNILWINANGKLVEGREATLLLEMQNPPTQKPKNAEASWPTMEKMLKFIQTLNSAAILQINSITPSQKN